VNLTIDPRVFGLSGPLPPPTPLTPSPTIILPLSLTAWDPEKG
jgi:hypothetical protein